MKTQAEIELAKIKAELDAKMAVLEAAIGNKTADIGSKVVYGMLYQLFTLPQRAIKASSTDAHHLGEDCYKPQ